MLRTLTAALALLLLPAATLAGYGGSGSGPIPAMYVRAVVKGGRLVVRQFFTTHKMVKKVRTRQVEENGKLRPVQEEYTEVVPESHQVVQSFDAARVRATDAVGTRVGAEALLDRLREETPALMLFQGTDLDPRYRTLLKKGTLILSVPRAIPPYDGPKKVPLPDKGPPPEKIKPKEADTSTELEVGLPGKEEPIPKPGPKVAGPAGPPPTPAGASVDSRGVLAVRESSTVATNHTVPRVVEKDGVKTTQDTRVKEVLLRMRVRSLDVSAVDASRADGSPVSPAMLRQLLRKEVPVLVSQDGRPVDPYYLEVIRPDALVLVLPTPEPTPPTPVTVAPPPGTDIKDK
jgi:hypothetical protein